MNTGASPTEIIESTDVFEAGSVTRLERVRVLWAITLALLSLGIATVALFYGLYKGQPDLQNWATGLISAIAGAAITYGFNSGRSE